MAMAQLKTKDPTARAKAAPEEAPAKARKEKAV
jgi:hypothetical protein